MDRQDLKKMCDWYNVHTDTLIPFELFIYIIDKVFISDTYTVSDFNELLLEKYNDEFVVDDHGKFIIRESRKKFIETFNVKVEQPKREVKKIIIPTVSEEKKKKVPKFKLSELGNGKMQFIKLQ